MFAPSFPPPGATIYNAAPSRTPTAPGTRATAPAPRRPAPAAQTAVAPTKPVVRAAPPDEGGHSAPLSMPSPERLGVAVPRPAAGDALDWGAVGRQMQQVGASGCHLDRMPEGTFRFTCWVPGVQTGVSRRIEAKASTEAEAARLALEQAAVARPRPNN